MSKTVRWLHFSDLHQGARGQVRDWPIVKDALARDLEKMDRFVGAPDVVLFTGDLAFKATEAEYTAVEKLLDWLDDTLGHEIPVFTVPGNHDLARPSDKDARNVSWLYSDDPVSQREREAMLSRSPTDVHPWFTEYEAFANRRLVPRLPGLQAGLLPGDTRLTLDVRGFKLGLLGLNSAWRQFSDDDFEGRVSVLPQQVSRLVPEGRDTFRQAHHLSLLLQHHPVQWLADHKQWQSHVQTAADLVLVGHMHDNKAEVWRKESNEDRPIAQARSLCGLEHYGTAREKRRFGYRWGKAEVVDAGVDGWVTRVRTWSRTLVENRRWAFRHPQSAEYEEDEGMMLVDVPVPASLVVRSGGAVRRGAPPAVQPTGGSMSGRASSGGEPREIDVFIAHASPDKPQAEALHRELGALGIVPFVDSLDIPDGEDWDLALSAALARSRVAAILVSEHYDKAYYLRDEVATVIARARATEDTPDGHRVVPVYLRGFPQRADAVPYGLRIKNSLDWPKLGGASGVAERLAELFRGAREAPTFAHSQAVVPPPVVEELSRINRYDVVVRLLPAQFEEVLFRSGAPAHELPPQGQPLATRALSVVQWLDLQPVATRLAFDDMLRRKAPGLFE